MPDLDELLQSPPPGGRPNCRICALTEPHPEISEGLSISEVIKAWAVAKAENRTVGSLATLHERLASLDPPMRYRYGELYNHVSVCLAELHTQFRRRSPA